MQIVNFKDPEFSNRHCRKIKMKFKKTYFNTLNYDYFKWSTLKKI